MTKGVWGEKEMGVTRCARPAKARPRRNAFVVMGSTAARENMGGLFFVNSSAGRKEPLGKKTTHV